VLSHAHHTSYRPSIPILSVQACRLCSALRSHPPGVINYSVSPVLSGNLCLLLVGLLEVLVGGESEGTTDQDDGVEADAQVSLLGAAGAGGSGGGLLGFGGGVVGLFWSVLV
jgi:hypothetical protein